MSDCKRIQRFIDEADRPDLLPYQIVGHVDACSSCSAFLTERQALRQLLASAPRVSAPGNFDELLSRQIRRLNDARKPVGVYAWFSPGGYLRLGTAAAGLLIAILGAQNLGLFGGHDVATDAPTPAPVDVRPSGHRAAGATMPAGPAINEQTPDPLLDRGAQDPGRAGRAHAATRARGPKALPPETSVLVGASVVIVRDQNGEHELTILPVSVGAQSAVYTSSRTIVSQASGVSF